MHIIQNRKVKKKDERKRRSVEEMTGTPWIQSVFVGGIPLRHANDQSRESNPSHWLVMMVNYDSHTHSSTRSD